MGKIRYILIFCIGLPIHTKEVEVVAVYYKKEVINDTVFVYREDTVNGAVKQVWSIDEQTVMHDKYKEAILQAELQERRKEREREEKRQAQERIFQQESLVSLNKKLLHSLLVAIEKSIQWLHDIRLQPFLSFNANSFASRELLDQLINEDLPTARTLLQIPDEFFEVEQCRKLCQQFDEVPQRLQELFQDSVRTAIVSCDDTKVLKELLTMVA